MINTVLRGLGDCGGLQVLQRGPRIEIRVEGSIALVGKSAYSRAAQVQGAAGNQGKLCADAVDRAYLARFTLGNAALEREVLELFASQTPVYLERLREAATAKDWKEAAHTIKGSASAIGAWRLQRFAELAERIGVEVEAAGREEAIAAVTAASDEVCRFIERLFPAV